MKFDWSQSASLFGIFVEILFDDLIEKFLRRNTDEFGLNHC